MDEEIKLAFTEEVDEYINDLQNAVGNKEKVDELLNLEHLPILVAYLRRIGMPEEYLEYAGVVDLTRFKMRDVLSCKSFKFCTVSDKGIEYEGEKENSNFFASKCLIGLDKNNTFWLDNERYFEKEENKDKIWLKRKVGNAIEKEKCINEYGAAYLKFVDDGRFFYLQSREFEDDVPYFVIVSSDGYGYESRMVYVDVGQPVYNGTFENTFEENYRMYVTLFPRIEEWYEDEYDVDESNVEEFSEKIEVAKLKEEIKNLNKAVKGVKFISYRNMLAYECYSKRVNELISYLKGLEVNSKEGKEVIANLLSLAENVQEENKDVTFDGIEDEDENEEEIETCDIDELNLIIKAKKEELKRLHIQSERLESANRNYRNVTSKLEMEIKDITNLLKKEKESGKEKESEKEREI